ncbi:MAG: hypothetical protein Q9174_003094 [Haloplaca sp. 1 TL-2023]
MVFKPFTHLARQSLGKTFTHGYAQSVVAATQSSYASTTTPFGPFGTHAASRFGKHGNSQLHQNFQHPSTHSGLNANHGQQPSSQGSANADGGLAAYYEAWQRQQHPNGKGREWKQFQFPLRIGWKAPSAVPENKGTEKDNARLPSDTLLERTGLERAYSTSAIEDIKKAEDVVAEAVAVTQVDAAIATEISALHAGPSMTTNQALLTGSNCVSTTSPAGSADTADAMTPMDSSSTSLPVSNDSDLASETSAWSDQVVYLRDTQRHAEIPALFELMFARGLRPSLEAYNALLNAAILLPTARHQVMAKLVGVYTSMRQHNQQPDGQFLDTILTQLSNRATDVRLKKAALDRKRVRFGSSAVNSRFLFPSDESEYAMLSEDDALPMAVQIFEQQMENGAGQLLSSEVYSKLVEACALYGRVDDMIRIYAHMEKYQKPIPPMFPAMVEAFARCGDLRSAVECYNEYRSMAIQDNLNKGTFADRVDHQVYAAVVKGYAMCGRHDGGDRFFTRIMVSLQNAAVPNQETIEDAQDRIVGHGLIQQRLDAAEYSVALRIAEKCTLTPTTRSRAMAHIACMAADGNEGDVARKAYQNIITESTELIPAATSLLALYIRQDQLEEARLFWELLHSSTPMDGAMINPITIYTTALIRSGSVDEATSLIRLAFDRMRSCAGSDAARESVKEEIDEALTVVGNSIRPQNITPSPSACMSLLWAMNENKGQISPISEHLLAHLGPEAVVRLGHADLCLLLQIEAELIAGGIHLQDVAHKDRFEHLLSLAFHRATYLDRQLSELVSKILAILPNVRPDLLQHWQNTRGLASSATLVDGSGSEAFPTPPAGYSEAFDPYETRVDHRGSNIIVDLLENMRGNHARNLDDALARFRNMRRIGRHPRYIVYARLLSAAAKESRTNLMYDILGIARQDMPMLLQNLAVRNGWSPILDAMIGACLAIGDRAAAAKFHQELLDIGSKPTANTFGLYITSLRESTRSSDEAAEALKIFRRAVSEGVQPTSFLYNALIGKLGKARRIDDCLFYFSQMRAEGVIPTSVTYGTVVNALCRVSDQVHAEELFNEMESMHNYQPRPAPYNGMMQFFLNTNRDSLKVLEYYNRMLSMNIQPTMHTYKLLIDTYATLQPVNLPAAEGVLDTIRASGGRPEAMHYASLVHAKGCALHDMAGARATFDAAMANPEVRPQACLYQSLFEAMVANHCVEDTEALLHHMAARRVNMTPYIANVLIKGWATAGDITKAQQWYRQIGREGREPSTYEVMTRGFLAAQMRESALEVVDEMLSRGYPTAVTNKVVDLLH